MCLIKRAKLFVFRRQHRHEFFDDAFQQELGTIYKDSPFGQEQLQSLLQADSATISARICKPSSGGV